MPYKNEHAVRVNDPNKYVKFARKEIADGISIIIGWTEDGKSEVQAYRFDKDKFTVEEVEKWLKEHKIEGKVEEAKEMEWKELEQNTELQDIVIFPRGRFFIQHLNRWIEFNDEFYNEILASFMDGNLAKPFIDKNHEKGESFGDIEDLYIAEDGMHAKVRLNEKGIELIKDRQYRYISPWFGGFTDTQGKEHKWVLFSVSLTNIPALSGELPELQEQMQLEMEVGMEKTKEVFNKLKAVLIEKKWIQLEDGEEKDFDTQVSEMLNVLYERMLALSDVAAQVKSLLAEKKAVEEKLEAEKQKVASLEQEKLEREAKEVIQKAVEQGKYPVALFEMKVAQYLKDREMVMKEIELLPAIRTKKEGYSFEANDLTEEDINNMLRARLNPQNPADVKIYKQANKR